MCKKYIDLLLCEHIRHRTATELHCGTAIRVGAEIASSMIMRALLPFITCCLAAYQQPRARSARINVRRRMAMAPRMGPILDAILDGCPLTGSKASSTRPNAEPLDLRARAEQALDDAEKALLRQAGLDQPLACTAAETAIETLVRSGCDELGSLSVSVNASSSADLLLRGQLMSATVVANSFSAAGFRAASATLTSDGLDVDVGLPTALGMAPRPPNLRAPTDVRFSCRLSQDDLNRSPLLFAALQELLRELLRTGVSAAIGAYLPMEGNTLEFTLRAVETSAGGHLVLVADATGTQADGRMTSLQGMRVQVTPMLSSEDSGKGLLILNAPKLLSTFEGFGARVELGLPFLRAAGVPLPPELGLSRLVVDDLALYVEGSYTLQPIDYQAVLNDLQAFSAAAAQAQAQAQSESEEQQRRRYAASAPDVVSVEVDAVDVEASSDGDQPPTRFDGMSAAERAALRLPPALTDDE